MTDVTQPVDIEALRQLMERATAGPWVASRIRGHACSQVWAGQAGEDAVLICGDGSAGDDDAALIVAAVNALPSLLTELEALRAERGRMLEALGKCRDQFQFYATEHKAKSDTAYKAWDDARYWGNVDEQNSAHKEYHKRLKQTQTNEAMVSLIDAALKEPSQ